MLESQKKKRKRWLPLFQRGTIDGGAYEELNVSSDQTAPVRTITIIVSEQHNATYLIHPPNVAIYSKYNHDDAD